MGNTLHTDLGGGDTWTDRLSHRGLNTSERCTLGPAKDCYKDKAPGGGGGAWLAFPAGLNEPLLPWGHLGSSLCLSF